MVIQLLVFSLNNTLRTYYRTCINYEDHSISVTMVTHGGMVDPTCEHLEATANRNDSDTNPSHTVFIRSLFHLKTYPCQITRIISTQREEAVLRLGKEWNRINALATAKSTTSARRHVFLSQSVSQL